MRTTKNERDQRDERIERAIEAVRSASGATSCTSVASLLKTSEKNVDRWVRGANKPSDFTARWILATLLRVKP